jgi:RNA polymerase sigma factor (sigma-70 family)
MVSWRCHLVRGETTDRLVDDASRGDGAAVTKLLERHLPALRSYVRRHMGDVLRRVESGSDIVQSTCREVLERLASERFAFRGEAAFVQWLHGAAILKIRQRLRHWNAGRRDVRRRTSEPAESDFLASFCSPSRGAMLKEDLERARRAFDQLSDRQQEVITMARIDGLGHREIGARLGITEAHSRVLLSRALARLATVKSRLDAGRGG